MRSSGWVSDLGERALAFARLGSMRIPRPQTFCRPPKGWLVHGLIPIDVLKLGDPSEEPGSAVSPPPGSVAPQTAPHV